MNLIRTDKELPVSLGGIQTLLNIDLAGVSFLWVAPTIIRWDRNGVCVRVSWHGLDVPVSHRVLIDNDMWRLCWIKWKEVFTIFNRVALGFGIVIEVEFMFQRLIDNNLGLGVNADGYAAGRYIVITADLEGAGHDQNNALRVDSERVLGQNWSSFYLVQVESEILACSVHSEFM